MIDEKKSWFKKTLEKYDQFCEELGVNRGACRGCVPVAKFDPEPESRMKKEKKEEQQTKELIMFVGRRADVI